MISEFILSVCFKTFSSNSSWKRPNIVTKLFIIALKLSWGNTILPIVDKFCFSSSLNSKVAKVYNAGLLLREGKDYNVFTDGAIKVVNFTFLPDNLDDIMVEYYD